MITTQQLSQRVFDFFNTLYGDERVNYGFSETAEDAFLQDQQNDDQRPVVQTALFYRISPSSKIGNRLVSDIQNYNRATNKEEIITMQKFTLTVNFLTKNKGMAKDAYNALLCYIQSTRCKEACYNSTFPLVLVNLSEPRNLTALEQGAWVERIEVDLFFNYNDKFVVGDIQFTQEPASVEEVRDIIKFSVNLKTPL